MVRRGKRCSPAGFAASTGRHSFADSVRFPHIAAYEEDHARHPGDDDADDVVRGRKLEAAREQIIRVAQTAFFRVSPAVRKSRTFRSSRPTCDVARLLPKVAATASIITAHYSLWIMRRQSGALRCMMLPRTSGTSPLTIVRTRSQVTTPAHCVGERSLARMTMVRSSETLSRHRAQVHVRVHHAIAIGSPSSNAPEKIG